MINLIIGTRINPKETTGLGIIKGKERIERMAESYSTKGVIFLISRVNKVNLTGNPKSQVIRA